MRKLVPILTLVVALGSSGVSVTPAAATSADSHARMVELLARLAEREPIRAATAQQTDSLKTRLFQLRRSVSDVQRLGIRHALGRAMLSHGDYYDALENFDQMLRETRVLSASQSLPVALTANFWKGATQMRLAEEANCKDPGLAACRFPFSRRWEARLDDWPRQATASMEAVLHLARTGSELGLAAGWLSHLLHTATGAAPQGIGGRVELPAGAFATNVAGVPRLADAADALGLAIPSLAGGLVVDDLDGDGWLDLVVSSADLRSQIRTYRNESGRFVEVTEESGLVGITGGHNLVQADYDNDGDLDILVLRGGWLGSGGSLPNSLLRNDGAFNFVDVAFDAGIAEHVFPSPVGAWSDYDADGDLDLFLGNDADAVTGFSSQLLRNDAGVFVDVSLAAGVDLAARVQGATWGDVDRDGWPDLFVSVFSGENRLYRNRRDGTFEDRTSEAGLGGTDSSGTTWFWDANGDGHQDLLVNASRLTSGGGPDIWYWYADLLGVPHPADKTRLYLGASNGTFREAAAEWGVDRVSLATGGNFGDLDNDGRLDFYLTTGYPAYEALVPDLLYRNTGGTFVDATYTAGVGELRRGAAVAFVDFDNDGDQDLLVKRGGLLPDDRIADSMYQNPGVGGRWLSVELRGREANRYGVGAEVRVRAAGPDGRHWDLTRWVGPGGSFGSGSLRIHFGLADAVEVDRVTVRWPGSGREQTLREVPIDARILVTEGDPRPLTLQR